MKRVLTIALLLFCSCMLFGQITCYQGTRSKGVAFYNQKQYEKAAKAFAAAKVCPDKPANNDIDAWIAKCKTQEEAQAKQEQAREQAFIDLGLPSGTKWENSNENVFYTYNKAVRTFGNRLPTSVQWEELQNQCKWTWTGSGYKVTGPNGNSITLPAAGFSHCDGGTYDVGSSGYYWSSTPDGSDFAWRLRFDAVGLYVHSDIWWRGYSVRLVDK